MLTIRNSFLVFGLLSSLASAGAQIPTALEEAFVTDRYKIQASPADGYSAWNIAHQFVAGFPDRSTQIETHGKRVSLILIELDGSTQTTHSGTRLVRATPRDSANGFPTVRTDCIRALSSSRGKAMAG